MIKFIGLTSCFVKIFKVLQHVRLPLLSPKFLVGTVSSDLLVRSDEECRDLVDEAKNYLLLPQERPLMQGPRTRPRKPTRRGLFKIIRVFVIPMNVFIYLDFILMQVKYYLLWVDGVREMLLHLLNVLILKRPNGD